MQEAPVAKDLSDPSSHRLCKGTRLAQAKEGHETKSKEDDKEAERKKTEVRTTREDRAESSQKVVSTPQLSQIRAKTSHVGMFMQYLQPTHKNLVFWLWWTLHVLSNLHQTAAQVHRDQVEQIALEECWKAQCTEGECTHTFWQDQRTLGAVYAIEGDKCIDCCAKVSSNEGQERGKGEGKEGSTGSRRSQATCTSAHGGRSARGIERATQEVDQRRARNHTWRCEEAQKVQDTSRPIPRGLVGDGQNLARVQSHSKEELGPAKRALPREEKKIGRAAQRSEDEARRFTEGGQGTNIKSRSSRGSAGRRGRREGGRRSRSPTMGGRGRRGRRGRCRRRRGHDSRGSREWEKSEVTPTLWREETTKEVGDEGGQSMRKTKKRGKKYEYLATRKDGKTKRTTKKEKEKEKNGRRPEPEGWTIPQWGTQSFGKGKLYQEAPFERQDSWNTWNRIHRRWQGSKKHEESRDLEELRFMVRNAMRVEEEERREEAEEQMRGEGGEDLRLEIAGLIEQRMIQGIPIWAYVLSQVHEETIYTRTNIRTMETPQQVVAHVIQEVRMRMRHDGPVEVILVSPQPPPHWRWGEDALHVIADIRPWFEGTPTLIASTFGDGADEDHPELGAFRGNTMMTCHSLLRTFGKLHRCGQRHTRCKCTHGFEDKGERQTLHCHKGDRIDLKMQYPASDEDTEGDEFAVMMTRNLQRNRLNAAYAYVIDEEDPRYFVGMRLDKHEYKWHIGETIRDSPSTPEGKKYEVYEVKPNPPDLQTRGIQGFILEEAGARAQTQTVILMDIDVIPNQGITNEGTKTFTEGWRAVERIQERLTRIEFLRELQVTQLCRKSGTCLLTMGGKPWREQDADAWWIMEGTFGTLKILNQVPEIPVSCQTKGAQENFEVEEFEDKWRKEKKKRKRKSEDDRQESQEEDESGSMLQVGRPSAAQQAEEKLPPPGNGGNKKVTFQDKVRCRTSDGLEEVKKDLAISNEFIRATTHSLGKIKDNPFVKGYVEGMRYEAEDEEEEEKDEDEEGELHWLPLASCKGTEEEPIDQSGQNEEESYKAEGKRKHGGKQEKGYKIRLEEAAKEEEIKGEDQVKDMKGVMKYGEWFNSHRVIPQYDLDRIQWTKNAREWLGLPIWVHGNQKVEEYHYYTDGSVTSKGGGAAAVLFIKSEDQWYFAGYVQRGELGGGTRLSSYQMELNGMILALKWIHDELKMHYFTWGCMPRVVMHFDAKAAGKGALGSNKGDLDEPRYVMARSIAQILEYGMGVRVEERHEYAHTGVTGNEMADNLAQDMANNQWPQERFWANMSQGNGLWYAQWLWWTYRNDCAQCIQGDDIYIPKPKAEEEEDVVKELEGYIKQEGQQEKEEKERINCKLVTFNVNTLKEAKRKKASIGHMEEMLKVMHEEKVTIFCLQETRIKVRLTNANQWYWIWQEEATKQGKGGVMIGISKHHPFEEGGKKITKENVTVVQGDEEHLLIKVNTGSLNFALLNAHAPHSGHTQADISKWWKSIEDGIKQKCEGWDIVTCIDANAKVGSWQSEAIGDHQKEQENLNGEYFHQYLVTTAQWVPATFEKCQVGQGKTFTYPGGGEARLDYICLPQTWRSMRVVTEVQDQISTRDKLQDHRPATLHLQGQFQKTGWIKHKARRPRFNVKDQRNVAKFKKMIKPGTEAYEWTTDIHLHVQKMNQMILDAAEETRRGEPKKEKKKEYLSDETWINVQIKRKLWKEHFKMKEEETRNLMRECWKLWRNQAEDEEKERNEDKRRRFKAAKIERRFREKSKQVTKMIRNDDQRFYDKLAQQMKEKEETKEAAGLWKCVRRHIPKLQERRKQRNTEEREDLDGLWEGHMAKIEAAVPRSIKEVYRDCIKRQNEEEETRQAIKEAPTLMQVEETIRAAKIGTAGGPDGIDPAWFHVAPTELGPWVWQILMKQHLWQVEAIQHKGGTLSMLEKKRGAAIPKDFRPIMLLSVFARRAHSLIREPLMQELEKDKQMGQIGGFRNQSPQYGTHLIRTLQKVAKMKGWCSAVLFLDLQTAFHSLLRELTLGTNRTNPKAKEEILKSLEKIQVDTEAIKSKMEEEIYLETLGVSRRLLKQLQDIGQENWVILYGHQMQTMKGTRPGSPLADAVFHTGMAEVQKELNMKLQEEEINKKFLELGVTNCPVTWADDVAITVIAEDAQKLDEAIEAVGAQANHSFRTRGMKLNYDKAKSEVIIGLAGPGAKEGRQRMLGGEKKDNVIQQNDGSTARITNVARYKHLGVQQQACGDMKEEVAYRIEQAWGAWRPLAPHVFLNRNLKVQTRLNLWQSLVLTRLYYAAGTWPVMPASLLKKIEATEMKMLRKITGRHYKEGQERRTNDEVRAQYKHPTARIRQAQERMTYARRLFLHAEAPLKEILKVEYEVSGDSWLHGLWADLDWLADMEGEDRPKNLEEIEERCKSRGWKRRVKKNVQKHMMQEEIIGRLEEGGRKKEEEEAEEKEGKDKRGEEKWQCECGKVCKTKAGLAAHKRQVHEWEAPEAVAGKGTRCEMCLRECWTTARLKQHLAYIQRTNSANRCFAMYYHRKQDEKKQGQEEDDEEGGKQWRLKGINRRDAIEAQGPKIFGFEKEDGRWAEEERQKIEESLKESTGVEDFDELWDQTLMEECETIYKRSDGKLLDILEVLEGKGRTPHWTALQFALWGQLRHWSDLETREEWRSYIRDVEGGGEILDWIGFQEKITYLNEVNQMQPHREVYKGAVNSKERSIRDAKIYTARDRLHGRNRSRVEQGIWHAVLKPKVSLWELAKILRDL